MKTSKQDPRAALPLWPWTALRPATGMLLGIDDFEVLAGNPRAKEQLHQAWLHGKGVVWGYEIALRGSSELAVGPGLAVDGWGRNLHLDTTRVVSFKDHVPPSAAPSCTTAEVTLCLIARFDACLDAPVPAMADPCDVTRENEEYSRVVEGVRLELVTGCPDAAPSSYHRVRVLLGLDAVGAKDEAGKEALSSRNEVLAAPPNDRARELLWHVRCLAAKDAADLTPTVGDCESGLFPTGESASGVPLGCVTLKIVYQEGCATIDDVILDTCQRPTLLPTAAIQELLCGLAPGLIGGRDGDSARGPQVKPDSIEWDHTRNCQRFSFEVTDHLAPATLTRDSITVTSLSKKGWVVEDLERRPRYDRSCHRVTVHLADRPTYRRIRIVVRGTGPTPAYGEDLELPLAGVIGDDDPGRPEHGRDAVLTTDVPRQQEDESHGNE